MATSEFLQNLLDKEKRTVVDPKNTLEKGIVGVPVFPLFLQRVLGTDIVTLNKIIEFAGPTGSGKSALAFYLMKLFIMQGGDAVLVETENKFNPQFFSSILGEHADNSVVIPGCTNLEETQGAILNVVNALRKSVQSREKEIREWEKSKKKDKGPRPELVRPVLLVLDSLAVKSRETSESIDKDGHASRAFPVEANLNSAFYTTLASRLTDIPLTFIYTNHRMKPLVEGNSFTSSKGPEAKSKGGDTPAFYASLRLFFEEAGAVKELSNNNWAQGMTCKTIKNSFNQKGTRSSFQMRWTNTINEDNDLQQVTWFDFESALTDFLAPSNPGFPYDREAVKKFLMVNYHSKTKYSCKGDIGEFEGNAHEVGAKIGENPEVCWKLSPYLNIRKFNCYPGFDKPYKPSIEEEVEKEEEPTPAPKKRRGRQKKVVEEVTEESLEEPSFEEEEDASEE